MRLRIIFSKTDSLRYIGHLDLHTIWERTARRADLPLAYSQGFHPQPKIHIAAALPLGFVGRAEIVDIWLDEPGATLSHLYKELLQSAAPPGLAISSVEQVDERAPALQTQVLSAEYEVILFDPVNEIELSSKIAALLAASSLPRERRGKMYDLRPLVESLGQFPSLSSSQAGSESGEQRIFMRLASREGATGRPEEVLAVLGIPFEKTRIERTRLILKNSISSSRNGW